MKPTMAGNLKLSQSLIILVHQLQSLKDSAFSFLFALPATLLSLLLIFVLAYNGLYVFYIYPPSPAITKPETAIFSQELVTGAPVKRWSSSLSSTPASTSNFVVYSIEEQNPLQIIQTNANFSQNSHFPIRRISSSKQTAKRVRNRKRKSRFRGILPEETEHGFSARIENFFAANSCNFRFFMTWISPLNSFRERELLAVESMFKSHADACLVIVSNSLDSSMGRRILKPFSENGFRVIAISPDFDSIFRDTAAEAWFNRLRRGAVNPGEVTLGQNLSNLLRLVLLYKFGGIYLDADILILKSFSNLRNVIGAQAVDLKTGRWSRLNNAVMIFDKNHPLLLEFIQEFAQTFDGNKWGHNGPYLVSRVVSRLNQNPGFNFTVLPPPAFYPVVWSRIGSLFHGPRDQIHSKWLISKLRQIQFKSFALHLWNRHSKKLEIQKGSVVDVIRWNCCIFCNHSVSRS